MLPRGKTRPTPPPPPALVVPPEIAVAAGAVSGHQQAATFSRRVQSAADAAGAAGKRSWDADKRWSAFVSAVGNVISGFTERAADESLIEREFGEWWRSFTRELGRESAHPGQDSAVRKAFTDGFVGACDEVRAVVDTAAGDERGDLADGAQRRRVASEAARRLPLALEPRGHRTAYRDLVEAWRAAGHGGGTGILRPAGSGLPRVESSTTAAGSQTRALPTVETAKGWSAKPLTGPKVEQSPVQTGL